MERELKRISLMIGEDQYEQLTKRGLNLSWLVRDLLDTYLNDNKITFTVGDDTRKLYEKIMGANTDHDDDFEPLIKEALRALLKIKIQNMQELEASAFGHSKKK